MMTFFAPAVEVLGGVVAVGEEAGRLDDDVDAEVAPRQRGGVALGEHLELLAVDDAGRRRVDLDRRPGTGPRIESYLSRWASVSASVRSLTATHSMSASCAWAGAEARCGRCGRSR